MYNFLTKNGQTVAFLLGVALVGIFLINVTTGMASFEALAEDQQAETGIFNFGLSGAIVLVIVAAIAMLLFGIYQVVTNIKGSLKGIIGLVVLGAVFFIAYNSASGEPTPFIQGAVDKFEAAGNGIISAGNLKFIGGGISTVVILVLIAVAAFVLAEIRNLFK